MLDVARLAEQLIADGVPSQTKVADAPVLVVSEGEHRLSAALKKIAHLVRTEGITVQHLDLEDVLSGAAVMKIAADEEAPMGGALSTHPLAIEARAFAAELRKFAADERRAKIASMELELEREIVAHHEKRANDQIEKSKKGIGAGTAGAIGAAGLGAGLAAPSIADAMRGDYQSDRPGIAITSSDGANVSGVGAAAPVPTPPVPPSVPESMHQRALELIGRPQIREDLSHMNADAAAGRPTPIDPFSHKTDLGEPEMELKPKPGDYFGDAVKDNEHLQHQLNEWSNALHQAGRHAYDYGSQFAHSIFGGP